MLGADAMRALREVTASAGRTAELEVLAELVVGHACRIAGGDAAVLRWFERSTGAFRLVASTGIAGSAADEIAADAPTAISEAFQTGRPVIDNDYTASGRTTQWGRRQKIKAQVAVPLLVEGRPVGTLAVLSHSKHAFGDPEAFFLSLMAAMVAPALEATRLSMEVRRQSKLVTDVYDALPVAMFVFDGSGSAIYHNAAAESLLGSDVLAGIRARTLTLYREDGALLAAEDRPTAIALRTGAPVRGSVVGVGESERRWFYMDAVPIRDDAGEISNLITSAIEITDLKAAEDRQRRDAETLRRLIAIQTELGRPDADEKEIMGMVTQRAVELTEAPGAALQMLDGDEVIVAAVAGFGSELLGRRLPAQGNPIRGCVAGGGAESTGDALVDPRCNQEVAHSTGIRSLAMAPVRREGVVIGGLQVQSPDAGGFPPGTETTLELLAGFAGAAITRAKAAKEVRAGEQLFSSAFQASGVGMALTALDGSVLRANPSLCRLVGYGECELVGLDARTLVAADDLPYTIEMLAGLYRRSDPAVVSTDLRVIAKDGRAIWARITASLVQVDGEPRHVLLHLVDLTEERKAQSILQSEQERLAVIITAQREIAESEPEIGRLFGALAAHAIALTGANGALVMFPRDERLVVMASAGAFEIPVGFSLPIDGSVAGTALRTREIQRVADAETDSRAHTDTARQMSLGAIIATPLITGDEVIGVLLLISSTKGAFDETDARTLEMIGGFAAAAYDRADATRRLEISEQRTRAVIESAPDPIVMIDSQGRIAGFNPAAEHAFLRNGADVIGESGLVLLPTRHAEGFARWIKGGQAAGSAEYAGRHFEANGRRSDGTEFPIEIAVVNLPEQMQLSAVFLRDLTLRDRLLESRERLAAVVSNAPVILLACDTAGVITLAEGKGLAALGVEPKEAPGKTFGELVDSQPDCLAFLDRAVKGETVTGQIHLRRSDRFLEGVIGPIRDSDGAVVGASMVLTDVTDRVHVDAAMRDSEAKSRLMAMMNHEVRTPLNSILGFAQLLTDPKFGDLTAHQRRYVGHIQTSGNHLLALVNESLDLAKLGGDQNNAQVANYPAGSIVEQAVDQVRPLAQARELELTVTYAPGVQVRVDSRHLVQVLLNLLSNAIRHTRPGGSVNVTVGRSADNVEISVADTGQGISREDLGRIFEEFYQATNHAPGGVGLGLAISRRLVQLMGGKIEVRSQLGKGSTFTVRLPSA